MFEGEGPIVPDRDELIAISAFNLMRNGMGGLDWSGFDLIAEYLGCDDIEGLIYRLHRMVLYKKPDLEN